VELCWIYLLLQQEEIKRKEGGVWNELEDEFFCFGLSFCWCEWKPLERRWISSLQTGMSWNLLKGAREARMVAYFIRRTTL
jgi:hypothetical protein